MASADQRIALIAADQGCTRPGCDQPPSRTEVHHIDEWVNGGRTDITVMTLACGGDHAHVHDGPGGWITELITSVTNTGRLPDGRSARIGWTQRGSGEPLRGNTVHKPRQYVDWFRQRLHDQMVDEQLQREHPDWWAEGRRWAREFDRLPDPEPPDWITYRELAA
ncbi:HNH endonuclease [Jongsikchunia kroppenstedtii]|uniref:HNH endonuclease n=1 Tax=Jongsikchunia kroppenstedtii TaxID=1121721 RepID=UPI0003800EE3